MRPGAKVPRQLSRIHPQGLQIPILEQAGVQSHMVSQSHTF